MPLPGNFPPQSLGGAICFSASPVVRVQWCDLDSGLEVFLPLGYAVRLVKKQEQLVVCGRKAATGPLCKGSCGWGSPCPRAHVVKCGS